MRPDGSRRVLIRRLDDPSATRHHVRVEWAQTATFIASMTAVMGVIVGLQTFWVSRSIDALRDEMHRGFDRLDARIDRLEVRMDRLEAREPPTLRRV